MESHSLSVRSRVPLHSSDLFRVAVPGMLEHLDIFSYLSSLFSFPFPFGCLYEKCPCLWEGKMTRSFSWCHRISLPISPYSLGKEKQSGKEQKQGNMSSSQEITVLKRKENRVATTVISVPLLTSLFLISSLCLWLTGNRDKCQRQEETWKGTVLSRSLVFSCLFYQLVTV